MPTAVSHRPHRPYPTDPTAPRPLADRSHDSGGNLSCHRLTAISPSSGPRVSRACLIHSPCPVCGGRTDSSCWTTCRWRRTSGRRAWSSKGESLEETADHPPTEPSIILIPSPSRGTEGCRAIQHDSSGPSNIPTPTLTPTTLEHERCRNFQDTPPCPALPRPPLTSDAKLKTAGGLPHPLMICTVCTRPGL